MTVPGNFVREFIGLCHSGHFERYPELGIRWNRSGRKVWQSIDPSGNFSFDEWDQDFLAAKAAGVTPLLNLSVNSTLEWAGMGGTAKCPPASPHELKRAVEKVVGHYSSPPFDFRFYEVSNEPNLRQFFNSGDERENYEAYIGEVLIPAAEVIHSHGGKVIAPSITFEWPGYKDCPNQKGSNISWAIQMVEDWLSYHDAWKHIDYFSFHYTKGDTEKPMVPFSHNLMPIYDYLEENWVKTRKIAGLWNTEEGLTAVHGGTLGFVSLKPWEQAPYGQWVPRYVIPFLHWALQKEWNHAEQYKLFWYHIMGGTVLAPTSVLHQEPPHRMLEAGQALKTLTRLFATATEVSTYSLRVEVGFGLNPHSYRSYRFQSYGFSLDGDLVAVAWMDLPGLETDGPDMQAVVEVANGKKVESVVQTHFLTGEEKPLEFRQERTEVIVTIPRAPAPVIYLRVSLK